MSNVLLSDISPCLKARLGGIDANPDTIYMVCGCRPAADAVTARKPSLSGTLSGSTASPAHHARRARNPRNTRWRRRGAGGGDGGIHNRMGAEWARAAAHPSRGAPRPGARSSSTTSARAPRPPPRTRARPAGPPPPAPPPRGCSAARVAFAPSSPALTPPSTARRRPRSRRRSTLLQLSGRNG